MILVKNWRQQQSLTHKLLLQMSKSCLDKKAALVAMDKDPVNLNRARQYFRLKKTQEDLTDAKASLMQILGLLRSQNHDIRQRSPQRNTIMMNNTMSTDKSTTDIAQTISTLNETAIIILSIAATSLGILITVLLVLFVLRIIKRQQNPKNEGKVIWANINESEAAINAYTDINTSENICVAENNVDNEDYHILYHTRESIQEKEVSNIYDDNQSVRQTEGLYDSTNQTQRRHHDDCFCNEKNDNYDAINIRAEAVPC